MNCCSGMDMITQMKVSYQNCLSTNKLAQEILPLNMLSGLKVNFTWQDSMLRQIRSQAQSRYSVTMVVLGRMLM